MLVQVTNQAALVDEVAKKTGLTKVCVKNVLGAFEQSINSHLLQARYGLSVEVKPMNGIKITSEYIKSHTELLPGAAEPVLIDEHLKICSKATKHYNKRMNEEYVCLEETDPFEDIYRGIVESLFVENDETTDEVLDDLDGEESLGCIE